MAGWNPRPDARAGPREIVGNGRSKYGHGAFGEEDGRSDIGDPIEEYGELVASEAAQDTPLVAGVLAAHGSEDDLTGRLEVRRACERGRRDRCRGTQTQSGNHSGNPDGGQADADDTDEAHTGSKVPLAMDIPIWAYPFYHLEWPVSPWRAGRTCGTDGAWALVRPRRYPYIPGTPSLTSGVLQCAEFSSPLP